MAETNQTSIIQEDVKIILVADASRYVAKKWKFVDQEVVCLTFLDFGKPNYKILPIEVAKKFLPIIPWSWKESLEKVIGMKLQVKTALATF